MPQPPRAILRRILRIPLLLYRWRCGWLLGHRFLLLGHTGRRTGLPRETVLEVLQYDRARSEAIVMSGFGRRADWFLNLEAGAVPAVVIGRQRFTAQHRLLTEDEAGRVLEDYERRNRFVAPVVRAVLSRLLGWTYHGTDVDRRRAVQQLPVVALTPHERASC